MAYRRSASGVGSWWDDFVKYNSPDAWGGVLADAYQRVQYGTIPAPGAGLPSPPAPAAPSSGELLTWTPADAEAATRSGMQTWIDAMRQTISDSETSGAYNPSGNLPVTADWMAKYGGLIAGAAALGLLAVFWGRR